MRDIYRDMAERTGGDIYIAVAGPVRTGKSTFIKRFSELLLLPNMENEYEKEQYEWLIHELESAKKCRFIFVFAHIPFFLEKDDEPEDYFCVKQPLRNKYIETFKRYGVNAIFCGHKHKSFVGKSGNLDMVTCGAIGLPLGGFHGMNLIRVFPDRYDFNYISLDDFPKAIEKNTLNLL